MQCVVYKMSEKKNSIDIKEVFYFEHEGRGIVYLKELIYWIRESCGADPSDDVSDQL